MTRTTEKGDEEQEDEEDKDGEEGEGEEQQDGETSDTDYEEFFQDYFGRNEEEQYDDSEDPKDFNL